MTDRLKVTTQGVNLDLTNANGDYDSIERGEMSPDGLMDIIKKVLDLGEPDYSSGEDLCPPNILVESTAGDVGFHVSDGKLFETNEEVEVSPFEAVMIATGEKSIGEVAQGKTASSSGTPAAPQAPPAQAAAPPPPEPAKRNPLVAFLRWVLGFILAAIVFLFGIAGGVGIIKNQDQPIMKMLGVVMILATLSFGRWLFRFVRGAKPTQTRAPSDTATVTNDTPDHFDDGFDAADDWDDGGEDGGE